MLAYQGYADSGVDFLGKLPISWRVTRVANVFEERKVFGNPKEELLSLDRYRGVIKQSETGRKVRAPRDRNGYKLIEPGQLGYNILNAFMGSVGVSRYRGIVSPAYAVARLRNEQNPWYFHYLLRTPLYQRQFNRFSYGIMYERNRLYYDRFKVIPIPVPLKAEQDQIVAYLRAQDAHIARFIKAKRDLIALLTERKLRIIDHAITRGLNASVKFKPSGTGRLGGMPEHWRVGRLKWVCRFTYGDSLSDTGRRPGGIPVYGSNGQVGLHNVANAVGPCIVIGRKGSFGKVNYSERDLFAIDTTFYVDRNSTKYNIRWLYYLLVYCRLDRISKDSAVPGLDRADAYNTLVPVCDVLEQERIAAHLDRETLDVDAAIARVNDEITLIREYRDRLITDAVTGQVDLRSWRPGPDDVVSDDDLAALGDDETDSTGEEDADGDE